jgi:proline dehydrogenase
LSAAGWARKTVASWSVSRRVAARFVAGDQRIDAVRAIQKLNEKGINATLDHLGEHTSSRSEAEQAVQEILAILKAIYDGDLRANVSIKLSQIGINQDVQGCAENLKCILHQAGEYNNFIRIDMEDSSQVDQTLELYWQMYDKLGLKNVGIVLQAYLYQTAADLQKIVSSGGRIRLCKGAYKEPLSVAFPKKSEVNSNFDQLVSDLVRGAKDCGSPPISPDGLIPPIPAIASHDAQRIEYAKKQVVEHGLPKEAIEFQMLFGIRRDLQEQLVSEGYPVRVYVPYGTEWYPYFMRRLAERPANLWFFVSNFVKN